MRVRSSRLELWFVVLTDSWCRAISRLASLSAPLPIMRLCGSDIDSMSPSVFHSSSAKLPLPFYFLSSFIYETAHQRQIKNITNAAHRSSSAFSFYLFFFVFHFVCCSSCAPREAIFIQPVWWRVKLLSEDELNVNAGSFSQLHSSQPPSIKSIFQQTIHYLTTVILFYSLKYDFWFPLSTILCLHCVL